MPKPSHDSARVRAGVYTRISSDPGGQGTGVERQRLDCEALCARRWEIAQYFEDNDASAYLAQPGRHAQPRRCSSALMSGFCVGLSDLRV